ncbi:MAG: chemotaxis protein CheD [Nitrospirae bacterium]|nr:chemotaxis protein CheD [Nitrospirota bacterium]
MTWPATALPIVYLRPGQMHIADHPSIVQTVLGSCVSVTFFNSRFSLGSICHGLLPRCPGKVKCEDGCTESFKYVECSVKAMIEQFRRAGIGISGIDAKVFGGADMFDVHETGSVAKTVGFQNITTALGIMQQEGIRVVARDVGGTQGRKLLFYPHTGEVLMKRVMKSVYDAREMHP